MWYIVDEDFGYVFGLNKCCDIGEDLYVGCVVVLFFWNGIFGDYVSMFWVMCGGCYFIKIG